MSWIFRDRPITVITAIALIHSKAIAIKTIGAGIIVLGRVLIDRLAAIAGLSINILIGC